MLAAPIQPDEAALVALLRAKDEAAFVALVERHHSSMIRIARVFVNDAAAAEEVAQEAWLAVLEGIDRFEGRSSLRSWLFSIVANRARTRAVRDGHFAPLAPEGGDEPAVDPDRFLPEDHPRWPGHWASAPTPWPEASLLLGETLRFAQAAIEALPHAQRKVIVLRDVEGFEAKEVCDALGVSEANQRVLLHRARSKVRAALEKELGGPR